MTTVDKPILNPLSVSQCFFVPADSNDWRREHLDLSAYKTSTEAIVKFNYLSALGGSINIDNIEIADAWATSVREAPTVIDLNLYPNPAVNSVQFDYPARSGDRVEVYHVSGALVHRQSMNLSGKQEIDVSPFESGYYLVKVFTSEGEAVRKLVVRK